MARPDITTCALLGLTLAFVSCVPPKAVVVAGPPAVVQNDEMKEAVEPVIPEPSVATLPDDDSEIRMPTNFLDLPSEGDFRGTAPQKSEPGSGAVISRPPTDPPSRVKPKAAEKE